MRVYSEPLYIGNNKLRGPVAQSRNHIQWYRSVGVTSKSMLGCFFLPRSEFRFFLLYKPEQYRKTRKNRSGSLILNMIEWFCSEEAKISSDFHWFQAKTLLCTIRGNRRPPSRSVDVFDKYSIMTRDRFFRVFRYCSGLSSTKNRLPGRVKKKLSARL